FCQIEDERQDAPLAAQHAADVRRADIAAAMLPDIDFADHSPNHVSERKRPDQIGGDDIEQDRYLQRQVKSNHKIERSQYGIFEVPYLTKNVRLSQWCASSANLHLVVLTWVKFSSLARPDSSGFTSARGWSRAG